MNYSKVEDNTKTIEESKSIPYEEIKEIPTEPVCLIQELEEKEARQGNI